jgi:hypothetical protein|tara:strand:+ start:412 stop:1293 length:882 start_codon:yes stop_codon:yes gene_type:complete
MEYLTGYTIKPYEVTTLGEVLFTDGTNTDIVPNQVTCEAYGYTYDSTSRTCRVFRMNTNLESNISNINNKNNGSGNTTELGSNTIQINGTLNTTKGFNNNCLINGSDNEIATGINNATVLGIGGKSESQGEFVIGGGHNAIDYESGLTSGTAYADRKMSVVNLSGVTIDNTATNLTTNGDETNFINVKNNSVVGFEIYITRLEIAGSSATAGNYSYRNIKGVVRIDNAYTMAFIVGFTRNIGKIGVNGTAVMVDSTTGGIPSISLQVTDRNNVTNIWSATVTLHELISTNITF